MLQHFQKGLMVPYLSVHYGLSDLIKNSFIYFLFHVYSDVLVSKFYLN